jgi:hypothetical protein
MPPTVEPVLLNELFTSNTSVDIAAKVFTPFEIDTPPPVVALNAGPFTGTPGVAEVNTVPELSGSVSVRSVDVPGEAIVNVPVPEALGVSEIFDNLFLLAEFVALATKGVAVRLRPLKTKHHVLPVVVPALTFGKQPQIAFVIVRQWRLWDAL